MFWFDNEILFNIHFDTLWAMHRIILLQKSAFMIKLLDFEPKTRLKWYLSNEKMNSILKCYELSNFWNLLDYDC